MTNLTVPLIGLLTLATFTTGMGQKAEEIKLKDFRPISVFKIPESKIKRQNTKPMICIRMILQRLKSRWRPG